MSNDSHNHSGMFTTSPSPAATGTRPPAPVIPSVVFLAPEIEPAADEDAEG